MTLIVLAWYPFSAWRRQAESELETEALAVRDRARRIPFLDGTLLSEDGKALALYLPLTSKDLAHRVTVELEKEIATFGGEDEYHITDFP